MQTIASKRAFSEINVTPMIDVILVLLIIFMVITPIVQMGYLARVPQSAEKSLALNQIVLRYDTDGTIWINHDRVSRADFPAALHAATGGNREKLVFFTGDPDASYQRTTDFLDFARSSGADNIALVVDPIPGR